MNKEKLGREKQENGKISFTETKKRVNKAFKKMK